MLTAHRFGLGRRVTRDNARSSGGGSSGDRFCLSGGSGGERQANVTLPGKHPSFHALFYPQMY
jgi:hypothetical protein